MIKKRQNVYFVTLRQRIQDDCVFWKNVFLIQKELYLRFIDEIFFSKSNNFHPELSQLLGHFYA